MSEVKRYYTSLDHGTYAQPKYDCNDQVVKASDFDAALSQLAALREERDQWRQMVGHICATIPLADVLASTATGQKTVDYFKALHQRLADAERRNADLAGLLRSCLEWFDDGVCRSPEEFNFLQIIRTALNKPEEARS